MANGDYVRERQKDRLKRQVVPDIPEEEPKRGFPVRIVLAVIAAAAVLALGVWFYWNNRHATGFTVAEEYDLGRDTSRTETFRAYESFADGILQYTRDGASYTNSSGKTIWERSYQMQNPIAEVNGDYAVIADQGAQSIYIFNDQQNTGVASAVYPVSRVAISQTGVVYAVLKDDKADYITAFKSDGTGIDLSIKSIITGDGYPLDIAVSPDGTELLTSYAAVESGQVVQKVVFRNFDEVGKAADARRVVGGFTEEFAGHLVGRVHFSDDSYSQAFYDGGIAFFSTKVLTSPELLSQESFEEEIASIAYSEKYAACVLLTNGGEDPYRLVVYEKDGTKRCDVSFDFSYTDFDIAGNDILLYNEKSCRVYSPSGREKAAADFPSEAAVMTAGRLPGEYLLLGGGRLQKVRLR